MQFWHKTDSFINTIRKKIINLNPFQHVPAWMLKELSWCHFPPICVSHFSCMFGNSSPSPLPSTSPSWNILPFSSPLKPFIPPVLWHLSSPLQLLLNFLFLTLSIFPLCTQTSSVCQSPQKDLLHHTSGPCPLTFSFKKSTIWKSYLYKSPVLYCCFLKDFIYLFLERGEGRERERETSMCGCLLFTPCWGPGRQPRHVPWMGIQPAMLWLASPRLTLWATPARTPLLLSSTVWMHFKKEHTFNVYLVFWSIIKHELELTFHLSTWQKITKKKPLKKWLKTFAEFLSYCTAIFKRFSIYRLWRNIKQFSLFLFSLFKIQKKVFKIWTRYCIWNIIEQFL